MRRYNLTLSLMIALALVLALAAACDTSELPGISDNPAPGPTFTPSQSPTPNDADLTATQIVGDATQTALAVRENPALLITPSPTFASMAAADCEPGVSNTFDGRMSGLIQDDIDAADLKDTAISVIEVEETDCQTTRIQQVQYIVTVEVSNIDNTPALADILTRLLAVLVDYPPRNQPALLSLRFEQGEQQRILEVDYNTALAEYNTGQRGEALLSALGGLR